MINSWVLKTGQWLIQHWFHKKIIFMTHGNDVLQMRQILCAASLTITCEYSLTSCPMCFVLKLIRNKEGESNGLSFSKV